MVRCFIINLERSIERKEKLQRQIKKLRIDANVSFEFFKAVDGSKNEHEKFNKYFDDNLAFWARGGGISNGEKACFASHFVLWQKCVELNESIIILEDDIVFENDFLQGIKDILDSNFRFVRLKTLKNYRKYKYIQLKNNIDLSFSKFSGAQGYYITPDSAFSLIKYAEKWLYPVDDYMDRFFIHNELMLTRYPAIIDMEHVGSTIETKDKTLFVVIYREILQSLYRLRRIKYLLIHRREIKSFITKFRKS